MKITTLVLLAAFTLTLISCGCGIHWVPGTSRVTRHADEGEMMYGPFGEMWSGTPWDESPYEREGIDRALKNFHPEDKQAVADLVEMLSHADSNTRIRAAGMFGFLGPLNDDVLPAMVKLLGDKELRVRGAAARALARIGDKAEPYILEAMVSSDAATREAAYRAYLRLGKPSEKGRDIFIAALSDPDQGVARAALAGLAGLGGYAKDAIPEMTELLANEDLWVRVQAARALGDTGEDARDALPMLVRGSLDTYGDAREAVEYALKKIDRSALSEIRGFMKEVGLGDVFGSKYRFVPIVALRLENDDDLQKLIVALEGDSRVLRLLSLTMLRLAAADAEGAIPSLIKALGDDDQWVRRFSAEALGAFGQKAIDAIPALQAMAAKDPWVQCRKAADEAVKLISAPEDEVRKDVIKPG